MAKTQKHGVWTCTYITPNGTFRVLSQSKPHRKNGNTKGNDIVVKQDLLDERTRKIINTQKVDGEYYNAYLYFMGRGELLKAKRHLERHLRHIGMTDRYIINIEEYENTLSYISQLLENAKNNSDFPLNDYYSSLATRLNNMSFEEFEENGFWHFQEPRLEQTESGVIVTYTDDFEYCTSLVRAYIDFNDKTIIAKVERKRKQNESIAGRKRKKI